MEKKSNYEIFKEDALKRFQQFDHKALAKRLSLEMDERFIYTDFLDSSYRFYLNEPMLDRYREDEKDWVEADVNEVLSLCDLLCHTEKPIHMSGNFTSLQGLNRVKGGSSKTMLGQGMFDGIQKHFDGKDDLLKNACVLLKGVPAGKGDVAYEIPLFGPVHVRFSFYSSDEEFPPQMTILFDSGICDYLHYETLYYVTIHLLNKIQALL